MLDLRVRRQNKMYETLEIELNNGVATVWMNRPDVHNAFNA